MDKMPKIFAKVAVSPVHGVGIVATKEIPKGIEPIASSLNEQVPVRKKAIVDDPGISAEVKDYIFDKLNNEGEFIYLPKGGLYWRGLSTFINHSASPNVMTPDGLKTIITLRKIGKGEELFLDYGKMNRPKMKEYSLENEAKYLEHLRSVSMRLGRSTAPGAGVGIIALKDIKKGEKLSQLHSPGDFSEAWANSWHITHYLRQSRQANTASKDGGMTFEAVQDIKRGEELTIYREQK